MRVKAGISMPEAQRATGKTTVSAYQHYEDKYKKPLLPLDFVKALVPIFEDRGVPPSELYALAGVSHPQESTDIHRPVKDRHNLVKESDTSSAQDQSGKEDTTLPKNSQQMLRLFNKLSPEKQLDALTHMLELAEDEDEVGRKRFTTQRP